MFADFYNFNVTIKSPFVCLSNTFPIHFYDKLIKQVDGSNDKSDCHIWTLTTLKLQRVAGL